LVYNYIVRSQDRDLNTKLRFKVTG
jgi:hypothetical protein